jgi:hypothetical protein
VIADEEETTEGRNDKKAGCPGGYGSRTELHDRQDQDDQGRGRQQAVEHGQWNRRIFVLLKMDVSHGAAAEGGNREQHCSNYQHFDFSFSLRI